MAKKPQRKKKATPINLEKRGRQALLPYLVLGLLAFLLYANTLHHDYVLDDRMVITDNSYTRAGVSGIPDLLQYDSMRGYLHEDTRYLTGGRYRPLSLILFALEYQFFGLNPAVAHFVTVMLYVLCALLLFAVLSRLFKTPTQGAWYWTIPFITTALFVLHPLHTEVVANIKSCDEILALIGSLAAWYAAIRYNEKPHYAWLVGGGIAFFAALMAKESAITFAAVIPLALWIFGQPLRRAVITSLPLFAAAAAFIAIRFAVLGFVTPQISELLNNPFIEATVAQKWATIAVTLGVYLRLLVFPHPLTYDYYPYQISLVGWGDWHAVAAVVLYTGLIVFAAVRVRKRDYAAFGVSLYLFTLSPVANIFFPVGTFLAERFLFAPSIGYCLLLTVMAIGLYKRTPRWLMPALIIVLAGFFAAKTITRNSVWKDNFTLTTTDVKVSANSASANTAAADWLIIQQESITDSRLQQAMIDSAFLYLHRAIRIHPRYARAHAILAENYDRLKQNTDSSLYYYRRLYRINPRWPNVAYNLGTLRLLHKPAELDSAIYFLGKCTEFFPTYGAAWKNLGVGYFYRKEYASAAKCFAKALQIDPSDLDTRNNAVTAYTAVGDTAAVRRLKRN
jgi:protein O-mannosyl-transferase